MTVRQGGPRPSADRAQDRADLAAQEDEGDDRDDRDEREDQRVLRETLSVVLTELVDDCLEPVHLAISFDRASVPRTRNLENAMWLSE